jgi:hypothetical protein
MYRAAGIYAGRILKSATSAALPVVPPAIPRGDAMDGRRMPEIMQTRLIAGAAVPLDAGNLRQATECFGNYRIFQGRAVLLAEQQVFAVSRMPAAVLRDECLQHRAQAGDDRDDARLEELNLVPLMWSSDRGRSTSSTLRRRASPRRSPAPLERRTARRGKDGVWTEAPDGRWHGRSTAGATAMGRQETSVPLPHHAMPVSIAEIDPKADGEPHHQSQPSGQRQAEHQQH